MIMHKDCFVKIDTRYFESWAKLITMMFIAPYIHEELSIKSGDHHFDRSWNFDLVWYFPEAILDAIHLLHTNLFKCTKNDFTFEWLGIKISLVSRNGPYFFLMFLKSQPSIIMSYKSSSSSWEKAFPRT